MSTRVTQNMVNSQFMRNLSYNFNRMDKLENQMSTGRQINKPSDDPVGLSFAMRYRSEISENEQMQRNLDNSKSWLQYTDNAMDHVTQIFSRVRELTVQALQGTNTKQDMDAISTEVSQLKDQMAVIGNGQFNGKYVFNGQMTDKIPYDVNSPDTTNTDNYPIYFEVGVGIKMPVNISGNQVFGFPGEANNAFKVLSDVVSAMKTGDKTSLGDALDRMDQRSNHILDVRADIGAKMNRLDLAENRLKDLETNLTDLQSKMEDADMADVITKMKMDENVYQATLSVGSKLIKQTLVDFLR